MIRFGLLLLVLPILVLLGVYFWELGDVRACQLDGGLAPFWLDCLYLWRTLMSRLC